MLRFYWSLLRSLPVWIWRAAHRAEEKAGLMLFLATMVGSGAAAAKLLSGGTALWVIGVFIALFVGWSLARCNYEKFEALGRAGAAIAGERDTLAAKLERAVQDMAERRRAEALVRELGAMIAAARGINAQYAAFDMENQRPALAAWVARAHALVARAAPEWLERFGGDDLAELFKGVHRGSTAHTDDVERALEDRVSCLAEIREWTMRTGAAPTPAT